MEGIAARIHDPDLIFTVCKGLEAVSMHYIENLEQRIRDLNALLHACRDFISGASGAGLTEEIIRDKAKFARWWASDEERKTELIRRITSCINMPIPPPNLPNKEVAK